MKPIAVVDVDETLWNFSSALYVTVKRHGFDFPPPTQWTRWNIFWDYISKENMFPLFDELHANQCNYLPFPDAKEFLKYLSSNHHVIIASHRNPKFKPELVKWLRMNKLEHNEVQLSYDKTVLFKEPNVDMIVDDRDETLNIALDHGLNAFGLKRPWNINGVRDKCKLFNSLRDIKQYMIYKEQFS